MNPKPELIRVLGFQSRDNPKYTHKMNHFIDKVDTVNLAVKQVSRMYTVYENKMKGSDSNMGQKLKSVINKTFNRNKIFAEDTA